MDYTCFPFLEDHDKKPDKLTYKPNDPLKYYTSPATVIRIALCFVLSTLNILMINGLKKTNKKLTLPQRLYLYLSCMDLAFSAICFPVTIFPTTSKCTKHSISTCLAAFFFGNSIQTFIVISIVRNYSIRNPFNAINSKKVLGFLIVGNCYFMNLSILIFISFYPGTTKRVYLSISLALLAVTFLSAVLIFSVFNIWSKRYLDNAGMSGIGTNHSISIARQRKAVTVLLSLTVIYAVCNIPLVGLYMYSAWLSNQKRDHEFYTASFLFAYFHFPAFLSTGVNSLIYMLKSPDIKAYYKKLSCSCFKKQLVRTSGKYKIDGKEIELEDL